MRSINKTNLQYLTLCFSERRTKSFSDSERTSGNYLDCHVYSFICSCWSEDYLAGISNDLLLRKTWSYSYQVYTSGKFVVIVHNDEVFRY